MALALAVAAAPASASQTQIHAVEGSDLFSGELEGASIGGDFRIKSGPDTKVIAEGLNGAVLAVTRAGDGLLYAATAGPGKVVRVESGKTDDIYVADKPLVTALLPVGKGTLVALLAPDAGAEVIELATKKHTRVASPAKLLLAGAVVDDVVYAVGGGDDGGVVLKLAPGAKAFETIATTKEPLRSIAARKVNGKVMIVVGGSDEGVVSVVEGNKVRALLDAAPGEVTSLAIAADGVVFAGFTDGDGKLSKQASAKARDDVDDDDKGAKKAPKARKVRGGEVWRIAADGAVRLLFQSKTHGPYALVVDATGKRVLVGTGPEGRVLDIAADGSGRPGVLTRKAGADEITALFVDKAGIVAGTSHSGSVLFVGNGTRASTAWLSPVLDADARARLGALRVRLERGSARVQVRTGNTKTVDDSWSAWSAAQPASAAGTTLAATPAVYAQVRVELAAESEVSAVHLAYLVDNRAPEIASIDVLAPGWKLIANPRDAPESRSVTFGEKPFAKFLDRRGGQNPSSEERGYGKQSFDIGYRSVYAYAEDADKDALRFRFWLGRAQKGAATSSWQLLKDWSEQPFASFEASRLADGDYQVKIDVDDSPTNGPVRVLSDSQVSAPFVVSHQAPKVTASSATRSSTTIKVKFAVDAALPLVSVRCTAGLGEWLPLDAADGIVDTASERFDTTMSSTTATDAISCEAYDEALNFARFDIPVR